MGIWAPVDSCVVSLGAKGLSGMGWKDSVRGGILSGNKCKYCAKII